MESDKGKLFVGGISWDTNEDRLREYFATYGEVVEAVIMKDRTTGRARGFGFVVFADPSVAERVVMEKHKIDGRVVEAKKAVPRDDLQALNPRSSGGSIFPGSPSPSSRIKKIFVGGLASTVTESDFRKYFEQFGTITDVVVMYDHNTQRPRGFGFITYDSEDAVDKVLLRTFHELNGKMVEVKRAVPKEFSPGPTVRSSPVMGYTNHGLNRMTSFLTGHAPGYTPSSIGAYGVRIDNRFGPFSSPRSGGATFPSFAAAPPPPSGYGRTNLEQQGGPVPLSYNDNNINYGSLLNYGRALNPYLSGNSSRHNFMAYGTASAGVDSAFGSTTLTSRNLWGNGGLSYNAGNTISTHDFLRNAAGGRLATFANNGINWDGSTPPISAPTAANRANSGGYGTIGPTYGTNNSETEYGLGGGSYGRNSSNTSAAGNLQYSSSTTPYEGAYSDLYGGTGDATWRPASSELDGSSPFDYGIGNSSSDAAENGSASYIGSYNSVIGRSNRGFAV